MIGRILNLMNNFDSNLPDWLRVILEFIFLVIGFIGLAILLIGYST
jgi:hypothetical protein